MNYALNNILVVDKDKDHKALMKVYLEKIGVNNITFVTSGEEAIYHLRNNIFHAVFLGGEMPDMGGKQLVGTLRDNPVCCHHKLAMVSGLLSNPTSPSPPTSHEAALRVFLGFHYVLPIPKEGLNSDVLLHALRKMVRV